MSTSTHRNPNLSPIKQDGIFRVLVQSLYKQTHNHNTTDPSLNKYPQMKNFLLLGKTPITSSSLEWKPVTPNPNSSITQSINETHNIKIIEIYGEEKPQNTAIKSILQDISSRIVKESTNQIDAVILKFEEIAGKLEGEVKKVVRIFGRDVLKSIILMPILDEKRNWSEEQFRKQIDSLGEVYELIKSSKGQDFNSNWYILWDSESPSEIQLLSLLIKIGRLQPYTHQMFVKAQEEVKNKLETQNQIRRIHKQLRQRERADKEYEERLIEIKARMQEQKTKLAALQARIQKEDDRSLCFMF